MEREEREDSQLFCQSTIVLVLHSPFVLFLCQTLFVSLFLRNERRRIGLGLEAIARLLKELEEEGKMLGKCNFLFFGFLLLLLLLLLSKENRD